MSLKSPRGQWVKHTSSDYLKRVNNRNKTRNFPIDQIYFSTLTNQTGCHINFPPTMLNEQCYHWVTSIIEADNSNGYSLNSLCPWWVQLPGITPVDHPDTTKPRIYATNVGNPWSMNMYLVTCHLYLRQIKWTFFSSGIFGVNCSLFGVLYQLW